MRLFAALVYICAGMWFFFWLLPGGPFGLGLVLFFLLLFSAVPLFNKGLLRRLKGQSHEQYLAGLDAKGELATEVYTPSRALSFEDLDTGSTSFFMDIAPYGILCLHGRYLHQFDDPPDAQGARVFPSRKFSLRRRKKNGEILDIAPQGKAFEPMVIAQPPRRILRELNIRLRDGDIYTHLSYEELIRAFARINA